MKSTFVIGVVGYVQEANYFDYDEAWKIVKSALSQAARKAPAGHKIVVVGGLTDTPSVHEIAYRIARQNGWNCGGIACKRAFEYKLLPMSEDGDIMKIVGDEWGDESEAFISALDMLIKVGGGAQSIKEAEMAKKRGIPVLEFELRKK